MSSNDRQKRADEPRPFFSPATPSEANEEATGLFDPRPQDVQPWALFERADVVSEALKNDVPEGQDDLPNDPEARVAGDEVEALDLLEDLVEDASDPLVEGQPDVARSDETQDFERAEDADAADVVDPEGLEAGSEEVQDLLDETLAEPSDPEELTPCPMCETTEAEAEATIDATIEALQMPYLEGSRALQRAAQDVSKDFMQNLVRLSVELAATVLRRSAEIDVETVLSSLDGALEIAGPLSEATVRCHPDDAPLLREHAASRAEGITGRLVDVAVRPTEGMERGACVVDFDEGLVDARWRVQLERLADAISPALIHHAAESASRIVSETMGMTDTEGLDSQGASENVGDEPVAPSEASEPLPSRDAAEATAPELMHGEEGVEPEEASE